MKIGITCYPTYGGSGALATELGLDLARRGHEVHFITYAMPFRLRQYTGRVYFHEVDTVSGRYPLFEHFPYTLALASKIVERVVLRGHFGSGVARVADRADVDERRALVGEAIPIPRLERLTDHGVAIERTAGDVVPFDAG